MRLSRKAAQAPDALTGHPPVGEQDRTVVHLDAHVALVDHIVSLSAREVHAPGKGLAGKAHETILCARGPPSRPAAPLRPNPRRSARMSYSTVSYAVDGPVARITLNRPEALNTIVPPMPDEVQDAVSRATRDQDVTVIVVRGAGRAFCAGYDLGGGFRHWDELITTEGSWDPGKDFAMATAPQLSPTQKLMSIWRTSKPVIAQVHGWCVGGGSDFALCADLVVASEDAVIGTPYSRMWGAYLSGMWIYRLGLARAKYHALTGRPLSGRQAAEIELINQAVPFEALEGTVAALAADLASISSSQLAAMKLVVNHAYENMGLASTQTLGPILDGLMRNTPDAVEFIKRAEREGVSALAAQRDAHFEDYSQAPRELQPDPSHVVAP
jgi:enoyl-CoA hydratase